jgi:tRNA A37 threonylcarbamoyladenosine dehydratase
MHPFSRTAALLGPDAMERIAAMRVFVFGVGGVGGWCAEALARTGVGRIAIVDDDVVAPSNINRQLVATSATIGRPKVEVLAERLREINPSIAVEVFQERFCADTEFFFSQTITGGGGGRPPVPCPVVIDAIDSLDEKRRLIRLCERLGLFLVSSMGAALRTDPTRVAYSRFSAVSGDPVARALRNRLRHDEIGTIPDFPCVCSTEQPRRPLADSSGAPALGSFMPVTAAFGMALAALAVGVAN